MCSRESSNPVLTHVPACQPCALLTMRTVQPPCCGAAAGRTTRWTPPTCTSLQPASMRQSSSGSSRNLHPQARLCWLGCITDKQPQGAAATVLTCAAVMTATHCFVLGYLRKSTFRWKYSTWTGRSR